MVNQENRVHPDPNQFQLVGFKSFVRTNPRSDRFKVCRFHHVEFYCGDATNVSRRFSWGLGLPLVGKSDLSTGNPVHASYLLSSGELNFVFTAAYSPTTLPTGFNDGKLVSAIPTFDFDVYNKFMASHGFGVRAVGVEVENAVEAFDISVANGAKPVAKPVSVGNGVVLAEVELYGDVVLRYVSYGDRKVVGAKPSFLGSDYSNGKSVVEVVGAELSFPGLDCPNGKVGGEVGAESSLPGSDYPNRKVGPETVGAKQSFHPNQDPNHNPSEWFLPGFQPVGAESSFPHLDYGLRSLDHAVGNVPSLGPTITYISRFTGFHEFAEFTADDVGTAESGLNSLVLANNDETVLLPLNEPTHGTKRKSQIQTYLDHNEGPGLQHLAISSTDIFRTLREMRARSRLGGFEFMPAPPPTYYRNLKKRVGDVLSEEKIKECEELGILVDRDDQGTLLQIFTKPIGDRPTIFLEIIQRIGCTVKDDEGNAYQKGGCGGFGKGNFSELFKSIEEYEKTLEYKNNKSSENTV